MMRKVPSVSPAEMLEEKFLRPLGLTKHRLAKGIGVPPRRIGDIVAAKRSITADTDLRLCRYFGLSDGWWLRGQANYDIAMARETMGDALSQISRCAFLTSCADTRPLETTALGLAGILKRPGKVAVSLGAMDEAAQDAATDLHIRAIAKGRISTR